MPLKQHQRLPTQSSHHRCLTLAPRKLTSRAPAKQRMRRQLQPKRTMPLWLPSKALARSISIWPPSSAKRVKIRMNPDLRPRKARGTSTPTSVQRTRKSVQMRSALRMKRLRRRNPRRSCQKLRTSSLRCRQPSRARVCPSFLTSALWMIQHQRLMKLLNQRPRPRGVRRPQPRKQKLQRLQLRRQLRSWRQRLRRTLVQWTAKNLPIQQFLHFPPRSQGQLPKHLQCRVLALPSSSKSAQQLANQRKMLARLRLRVR
mmetsp:Transcript_15853/g.37423  ORF Transcript_15853/g.37423 Transcript_15853/m.37423 type:complete len:258 (+) Transcript_15853:473-1246(+)